MNVLHFGVLDVERGHLSRASPLHLGLIYHTAVCNLVLQNHSLIRAFTVERIGCIHQPASIVVDACGLKEMQLNYKNTIFIYTTTL